MRTFPQHTVIQSETVWQEEKAHQSSSDDATFTSANASVNTLAGFLVDSGGVEAPQGPHAPQDLLKLRKQKEEGVAAVNALNQFIFVAGNIYKGRRLNKRDEKRLREAATHVGLSQDVVNALIEQTSDTNAVVKYCKASNNAFARKMKEDPELSWLLQAGGEQSGEESDFDMADSVWRVFMHKIVQEFLKEHGMDLGDVMNKESLTSRLYFEALRNDTETTEYSGVTSSSSTEQARIRRDYTKERQKVSIPVEEARLARRQAEANLAFEIHRPFYDSSNGENDDYVVSDANVQPVDDALSLNPGAYPSDVPSDKENSMREDNKQTKWKPQNSFGTPSKRPATSDGEDMVKVETKREHQSNFTTPSKRPAASDGEEMGNSQRKRDPQHNFTTPSSKPAASDGEDGRPVSAVKRGLAMFGQSAPQEEPGRESKQNVRTSVAQLQQSLSVSQKRGKFVQGADISDQEGFLTPVLQGPAERSASTSKIQKLNPEAKRLFDNGKTPTDSNRKKLPFAPGTTRLNQVASATKVFERQSATPELPMGGGPSTPGKPAARRARIMQTTLVEETQEPLVDEMQEPLEQREADASIQGMGRSRDRDKGDRDCRAANVSGGIKSDENKGGGEPRHLEEPQRNPLQEIEDRPISVEEAENPVASEWNADTGSHGGGPSGYQEKCPTRDCDSKATEVLRGSASDGSMGVDAPPHLDGPPSERLGEASGQFQRRESAMTSDGDSKPTTGIRVSKSNIPRKVGVTACEDSGPGSIHGTGNNFMSAMATFQRKEAVVVSEGDSRPDRPQRDEIENARSTESQAKEEGHSASDHDESTFDFGGQNFFSRPDVVSMQSHSDEYNAIYSSLTLSSGSDDENVMPKPKRQVPSKKRGGRTPEKGTAKQLKRKAKGTEASVLRSYANPARNSQANIKSSTSQIPPRAPHQQKISWKGTVPGKRGGTSRKAEVQTGTSAQRDKLLKDTHASGGNGVHESAERPSKGSTSVAIPSEMNNPQTMEWNMTSTTNLDRSARTCPPAKDLHGSRNSEMTVSDTNGPTNEVDHVLVPKPEQNYRAPGVGPRKSEANISFLAEKVNNTETTIPSQNHDQTIFSSELETIWNPGSGPKGPAPFPGTQTSNQNHNVLQSHEGEGAWVEFGSSFVEPRQSLPGRRSGRGLSECENDSIRQPTEKTPSHPCIEHQDIGGSVVGKENAKKQENGTNSQSRVSVAERVDSWSKKARTLLSDDEQPKTPTVNGSAQLRSNNGRSIHDDLKPDRQGTGDGASTGDKGEWAAFSNNVFSPTPDKKLCRGQQEADARRQEPLGHMSNQWQQDSTNVSEETDEESHAWLPKSIDISDSQSESHSQLSTLSAAEQARVGSRPPERFSMTPRQWEGFDEAEASRRKQTNPGLPRPQSAQQKKMTYNKFGAYAKGGGGRFDSHPASLEEKPTDTTGISQTIGESASSSGPSQNGMGTSTEESDFPALNSIRTDSRSLSSESDFNAMNIYQFSDVQRIQSNRHSELSRIKQGNRSSLQSNMRDPRTYPPMQQPSPDPRIAQTPGIIAGQAQSVFSCHSASNPIVPLPGDSLNGIPGGVAQIVAPHDLVDAKGCIVNGVPFIESSYRPMNGGAPTLTPVQPTEPMEKGPSVRATRANAWVAPPQTHEDWDSGPNLRPDEQPLSRDYAGNPEPHLPGTDPSQTVYGQEWVSRTNAEERNIDVRAGAHPSERPHGADSEFEALSAFLDDYEYDGKPSNVAAPQPQTPNGIASQMLPQTTVSSEQIPKAAIDEHDIPLELSKSESTLSNFPVSETERSGERETLPIAATSSSQSNDVDRYDEREPDFEEESQGPTSPTQLRSSDSESTVDEETLRRVAETRGIPADVMDVLLSQAANKSQEDDVLHPRTDKNPIDSDTCQPASARHLRKDVGPAGSYPALHQEPGNNGEGTDWVETETRDDEPASASLSQRDPTPTAAQAIVSALHENTMDNRRASMQSMPGMPDLPEGATEEELNLLNRFIEVAAGNFDGKKLSAESESRVRSAALKVGLSVKFVDQLLEQADSKNATAQAPVSTVRVPEDGQYPQSPENTKAGSTTFYTVDLTQMTKKTQHTTTDATVAGCGAWESFTNALNSWTNCGAATGGTGDDGSSISSAPSEDYHEAYRDELTKKLEKATKTRGKNVRALV